MPLHPAEDLRRLTEMGKATLKATPVIIAGTMQYEVVDTFRYLGILIGPHTGKKWGETFKMIEAKIHRVYGMIKYRKGITTARTQQIFVASLYRYYCLPYVISGRISLTTLADSWTTLQGRFYHLPKMVPFSILEVITPQLDWSHIAIQTAANLTALFRLPHLPNMLTEYNEWVPLKEPQ